MAKALLSIDSSHSWFLSNDCIDLFIKHFSL